MLDGGGGGAGCGCSCCDCGGASWPFLVAGRKDGRAGGAVVAPVVEALGRPVEGYKDAEVGGLARALGSVKTMPSRLCISSRDRGRKGSEAAEALSWYFGLETEERFRGLGMLRRAGHCSRTGQDGRDGCRESGRAQAQAVDMALRLRLRMAVCRGSVAGEKSCARRLQGPVG